jgi:hypothetical protein
VVLSAPPDPRTGAEARVFDPLEFIHAATTQIPDPRQHLVRYYGAYANRIRARYRTDQVAPAQPDSQHAPPYPEDAEPAFVRAERKSWARLLRRIFEVDPLLCKPEMDRSGLDQKSGGTSPALWKDGAGPDHRDSSTSLSVSTFLV